jgi:hypothetical protein
MLLGMSQPRLRMIFPAMAWRGKAKIKARLIGKLNPDEWDLPPKPKGMRWSTYKRYEEKYDYYEDILDERTFTVVARFLGRG